MLNISATLDITFNLNQVCLIATSLFLYKMANIYLSIYQKENIQNLVRLNILYVLTNMYNKNQANNIFY